MPPLPDPDPPAPEPDFPSGEWLGDDLQDGSRVRQEPGLTFGDRRVSGAGSDPVGEFSFRGRFDAASREIRFTNGHRGERDVHDRRLRMRDGIRGAWTIGRCAGASCIWPRTTRDGVAQRARRQAHDPADVRDSRASRPVDTHRGPSRRHRTGRPRRARPTPRHSGPRGHSLGPYVHAAHPLDLRDVRAPRTSRWVGTQ